MLMLFTPAGIPHLLSKPVLQHSHAQSKPHFAFATQTGAQKCEHTLQKYKVTESRICYGQIHLSIRVPEF